MDAELILKLAVNALNNKKARQLNALKIDELTTLCEYFVIATATSSTHLRALAGEVEDVLKSAGLEPHHSEGKTTGWIVIDYKSVVVHIFTADQRDFYNLDSMWRDATKIELNNILDETEDD